MCFKCCDCHGGRRSICSSTVSSLFCLHPPHWQNGVLLSFCLCSRLGILEEAALRGWLGSALTLADQLPGRERVVCDLTGSCVLALVSLIQLWCNKKSGGGLRQTHASGNNSSTDAVVVCSASHLCPRLCLYGLLLILQHSSAQKR